MERISGMVSRVKGQGFQLEGHNGTWFNVSKFAEGVDVPTVGASVAVDLDGKGFVRRVETAASANLAEAATETPAICCSSTDGSPLAATRLACLTLAATILGAGPGCPVDPTEVAKLAARLERWVVRPA